MYEFSLDNALTHMNFKYKHPEIFQSGKDKLIEKFLDYFVQYNKLINSEKNGLEKLINKINSDFKVTGTNAEQLQINEWNETYFKFCVKKTNNDIYIYPRNTGGEKLTLPYKYFVNCIKLENANPNTLAIVNRNNHMMLSGESKNNDLELGKELHFKILIIYSNELKKWLVVPYRMVSKPTDDVRCDSFALSATTNNVARQYKIWMQGLERYNTKIGILNYKYLNEHYKTLPNLFGQERSNTILTSAQMLLDDILQQKSSKTKSTKKTPKKKSSKTKSTKKTPNKKSSKTKSTKKTPNKKSSKTKSTKKTPKKKSTK